MNPSTESPKPPENSATPVEKSGRRRFLGAGTAATPVILTLFSQPALGVTCFTPSRSLSRNTSVSQQGKNGECTGAQSPGNYSAQTFEGRPSYSWPIPPETAFHSIFTKGTVQGVSKFTKIETSTNKSGKSIQKEVSLTMFEVLNLGGNGDLQKVAFHLIGAYLNCLGGGGSRISPLAMTPEGVQKIWTEWATKGYYEVTAGVRWGGEEIKLYLKDNGIVA